QFRYYGQTRLPFCSLKNPESFNPKALEGVRRRSRFECTASQCVRTCCFQTFCKCHCVLFILYCTRSRTDHEVLRPHFNTVDINDAVIFMEMTVRLLVWCRNAVRILYYLESLHIVFCNHRSVTDQADDCTVFTI